MPEDNANPLNIRLHFPTPSAAHPSPLNFESFSSSAQRLFRLELAFLHGHVQINWNGLLSSWHTITDHNHLEIKLSSSKTEFKINGKMVNVQVPELVSSHKGYKLTYDETAVPDSDWLEMANDPEILESLQISPPLWQPPLLSADPIEEQRIDSINYHHGPVDYIVYDNESFTRLQISSGIPLPKVEKTKSSSKTSLFTTKSILKFFFKRSAPLPVLHGTKKSSNTRLLGTFVITAFLVYLAVLLHLSKMTSIRPSLVKKSPVSEKLPQSSQQPLQQSQSQSQSQSRSLSQSQLKLPKTVNPFKSPSRTILIDLPDAPLFKSSLSTSGSILKVSVPAAFSLADNRHILFPSKLRK